MASTGSSPITQSSGAPRLLIVTDHTELGRALEQHVSIIWPDAECRIHAPLQSGRLHSGFNAVGYDVVLLDDRIERGQGEKWLDNLLHRNAFPPIVYLARADDPGLAQRVVQRGAIDCLTRERIDHRRMADVLRKAMVQRREQLALLRTGPEAERLSQFGAVTIRGHRFVRELAVGGTSAVYLAESERAGEMVVLKVLRDSPTAGDEHTQFTRFMQEYELISKVRHPNVVRIFDLGIADDHAYLAMEYFSRGDLRSLIASGLDGSEALSYLAQMAAALEVVHAVGVLHRDLKPGNIMLRADGSVALIDFGLAKHVQVDAEITATGEIFGTPYYMSPEQGHGQQLDERSDLYSLGVIFYEMLMRQKPYVAQSPMAVIYMHANAPIPLLPESLRNYQQLLNKLLAKDPMHRFASASALLGKIEELR
ncbi:MAG TPA: protein kinase [Steroidobacteraceae bacterium]|nr:protein kinase [Steroidobacteraceae bacterium]